MNTETKLYLQEVLGIKQWLTPPTLAASEEIPQIFEFDGPMRPERVGQSWALVSLHLNKGSQSYFEGESLALFQKMKAAMKLAPQESSLDLEIPAEHQEFVIHWIQRHLHPKALLVLSEVPRNNQRPPVFETWSPSSLLQNGERKKAAWEVMQKAIGQIKKQN